MRTLLIDNYDSFTYNLFQLLGEVNGVEPIVVRNDETDWEGLSRLEFDNVVLSPGPGGPERARDFGVCAEAIRHCETPLLGVCLGHQGLGWVYGGRVVRAPEPLHGRVRTVEHAGAPLFAGIPERFEATRYHSLQLDSPLPSELEPIAWAEDGTAMAIAHRTRPQWGVQFHPESIATEHGKRLLANFRDLTTEAPQGTNPGGRVEFLSDSESKSTQQALKVRELEGGADPARAFAALYGESASAFWLDSSRPGPGARFSFMGDAAGPLGATIAYDVEAGEVTVNRGVIERGRADPPRAPAEVRQETILEYLDRELTRLRPSPPTSPSSSTAASPATSATRKPTAAPRTPTAPPIPTPPSSSPTASSPSTTIGTAPTSSASTRRGEDMKPSSGSTPPPRAWRASPRTLRTTQPGKTRRSLPAFAPPGLPRLGRRPTFV